MEDDNLKKLRRNRTLSESIMAYLKSQGKPIKEKDLITKVYFRCNEIITQSVMIELKAKKLVTVENGQWSIGRG